MTADVASLVVGLLACLLAAIALWTAFGSVNWALVSLAAPIALITVGLLGLILARKNS